MANRLLAVVVCLSALVGCAQVRPTPQPALLSAASAQDDAPLNLYLPGIGGWRSLDLTPRLHCVERYIWPTSRIQTELIDRGVCDPGNFHMPGFSASRHELLVIQSS